MEVSLLKGTYEPTPTHTRFLRSRKMIKILAGPVGGGKTTVASIDLYLRALRQPANRFGVRESKIMIARAEAVTAFKTTMKTWAQWIPAEFCIRQKNSPPYELGYEIPLPDGTKVSMSVEFLGLDPIDGLAKLKSTEYTMMYLNEADQIPWNVLLECLSGSRLRFPSKKDAKYPDEWLDDEEKLKPEYVDENGFLLDEYSEQINVAPERGVIIDFNLTGKDHDIYKLVNNLPDNAEYFEQPAAMICENFDQVERGEEQPILVMNPLAENVRNLAHGYYPDQAKTKSWTQIKRDILMVWANIEDGVRVHPEFKRINHVRKTVDIVEGAFTLIGFDTSGYNPAAVIGQVIGGTYYVTDTLYEPDTSLTTFIDTMLMPLISQKYQGCEIRVSCDPSGPRGVNDLKPFMVLREKGLDADIAPTNDIAQRIQAVAKLHKRQDGVFIGTKETLLIEGLETSYIFKRNKNGGGLKPTPDKMCPAGHLCDAYQYAAVSMAAHEVRSRRKPKPNQQKRRYM